MKSQTGSCYFQPHALPKPAYYNRHTPYLPTWTSRCSVTQMTGCHIGLYTMRFVGFFVCVYTYVHTCSACAHKCILTCMHVHAEKQRSMSDIFLNHSLPCFLRQGLSLSLKLMNSAGLAGQQPLGNPTVSVSPALDYRCLGWLVFHCSWFCFSMGSGELNVGPHAFMVSTSLPEPSLLSLANLLKTQRCLV